MKQQRQAERAIYTVHDLVTDLKSCSIKRDLQWGRRIHAKAVETRNDSNVYVVTALIKMYGKCGSMVDARRLFDSILKQDVVSWTALLLGYAQNGEGRTALDLFSEMKAAHGCTPDAVTYVAALKACTSLVVNGDASGKVECLKRGREIHSQIGHHLDHFVKSMLIDMYGKCGSMVEARQVFDSVRHPDVVSWTSLILGYAENGEGRAGLDLFSKMKFMRGCTPNSVTYVSALKACTSLAMNGNAGTKKDCLERGREIHLMIGDHLDNHVMSTLIAMYAKCGSMVDACRVFDSVQDPDAVIWTALIMGYAENGEGQTSLNMFSKMQNPGGCTPNSIAYVAALKACTCLIGIGKAECLERGREIHLKIGTHLNRHVQNALIDMYAHCGSMTDARQVFNVIRKPDIVSWNALIQGYAENGEGHAALDLFSRMKAKCERNPITYVAALKACTLLAVGNQKGECLRRGREIHLDSGRHMNLYVQNTLMHMYASCGSMTDARLVFDSIQTPDVVSWTAIIIGYAENGEGHSALALFSRMKARGCVPDSVTYVAALKACTSLAQNGDPMGKLAVLECGKQIHSEIGHKLNIYVNSTLIDMYGNCGSMVDARRVFNSMQKQDVVSWTALILGYAQNGEGHVALDLFSKMKAAGKIPDSVAYVAVLRACSSLVNVDGSGKRECLELGKKIHSEIDCHLNSYVKSTLIDMYAKCDSMVDAHKVFDSIQNPDVVSWTALILGYAESGAGRIALDLFLQMKVVGGCAPNSVTYIAALKACGLIGDLALGRELHLDISEFSTHVVTSLVNFYAKCGSMVEACAVFDLHSTARVVSTWNALLAGYGSFGDNDSVFNLFEAMQDQGFQPDAVTFVCLLSCCSRAGLVEKSREYFEAMPIQYGITHTMMHHHCMVDILGRANYLQEAVAVLQNMPYTPSSVTWITLLGACCKWKNIEIGRWAFQSLLSVDKKFAPGYVLMAQIYGMAN